MTAADVRRDARKVTDGWYDYEGYGIVRNGRTWHVIRPRGVRVDGDSGLTFQQACEAVAILTAWRHDHDGRGAHPRDHGRGPEVA